MVWQLFFLFLLSHFSSHKDVWFEDFLQLNNVSGIQARRQSDKLLQTKTLPVKVYWLISHESFFASREKTLRLNIISFSFNLSIFIPSFYQVDFPSRWVGSLLDKILSGLARASHFWWSTMYRKLLLPSCSQFQIQVITCSYYYCSCLELILNLQQNPHILFSPFFAKQVYLQFYAAHEEHFLFNTWNKTLLK